LRDGNTGRVRRIIWIGIATCLVTIALVDKVGRKPILWVGSLGMALTLGLIAFAFSTATQVDGQFTLSDNMGVLALLAANAYVMIFNGSWGPVMWVMLGEIFLNQIRGSGLAIARLSQWNVNVLITMSFPFMLASIGLFGAHGIYAFFTRLSAIFVSKMVHETRGLELEEMTG
jgi:SP family sugar:H+ symporter-like MFS transporter